MLILSAGNSASAQNDSGKLTLNAYFDSYYATYTDDDPWDDFQKYTTVSPRDNHFGINAMQLGIRYEQDMVRGALTLHYGDIAQATWSEEFEALQEGWAGLRLAGGLWLDAGFFTTHVGTESFLPKDNLLSSTAVATYIGPFYQGGARLSYEGSEKFKAALYVINGYNQFLDENKAKSAGIYFTYAFSNQFSLTYSNMLGRESEEDAPENQFLVYHNLYGQWEQDRWQVIAGGDLATQTHSRIDDTSGTAVMSNFLATVRYKAADKCSLTGRFEWYDDPDGFLSGSFDTPGGERGLTLSGYTLGAEYAPVPRSFFRVETRYLKTYNGLDIFAHNETPVDNRWEFMVTLGVYLDEYELFR